MKKRTDKTKNREQKALFDIPLGGKRIDITKSKIEWIVLIFLAFLIPLGQLSGFFSFEYGLVKCGAMPVEVVGSHYRLPGDKGYGINAGSDYSYCAHDRPAELTRDPSTKVGAMLAAAKVEQASLSPSTLHYVVYVPEGHATTAPQRTGMGETPVVNYSFTSNSGMKFDVLVMKKDNSYNYAHACLKHAEGDWFGYIIGKDGQGREICRVEGRYLAKYTAGVMINETAVILQTTTGNNSTEKLDAEAKAILSSMVPYSE